MHVICNECFKKAGPMEELTIGVILGVGHCAYCGQNLEGEDYKNSHRLAGDFPLPEVLHKLGFITVMAVLVRREPNDDAIIHVVRNSVEHPSEVIRIGDKGFFDIHYRLNG